MIYAKLGGSVQKYNCKIVRIYRRYFLARFRMWLVNSILNVKEISDFYSKNCSNLPSLFLFFFEIWNSEFWVPMHQVEKWSLASLSVNVFATFPMNLVIFMLNVKRVSVLKFNSKYCSITVAIFCGIFDVMENSTKLWNVNFGKKSYRSVKFNGKNCSNLPSLLFIETFLTIEEMC